MAHLGSQARAGAGAPVVTDLLKPLPPPVDVNSILTTPTQKGLTFDEGIVMEKVMELAKSTGLLDLLDHVTSLRAEAAAQQALIKERQKQLILKQKASLQNALVRVEQDSDDDHPHTMDPLLKPDNSSPTPGKLRNTYPDSPSKRSSERKSVCVNKKKPDFTPSLRICSWCRTMTRTG
eukprot:TRINITY_DN8503_c0_g1_i2.p1 TRINITY_DN8503_c0_g1~~TRINITY_DN8503_c0_g1_i2.p1  ORF type:complete len:196 (+),score=24.31 TRINITY_DN8503_c0_g1_i2:55-588(+)